jgi:hypothetical protein
MDTEINVVVSLVGPRQKGWGVFGLVGYSIEDQERHFIIIPSELDENIQVGDKLCLQGKVESSVSFGKDAYDEWAFRVNKLEFLWRYPKKVREVLDI